MLGTCRRPLLTPLPLAPLLVPDWWPDEVNAWRSEIELEGFALQEPPEYDAAAQGDAGDCLPDAPQGRGDHQPGAFRKNAYDRAQRFLSTPTKACPFHSACFFAMTAKEVA